MLARFILSLSLNSIMLDIIIGIVIIMCASMIMRHFLVRKMWFYIRKHPDKAKEIERYWTKEFEREWIMDYKSSNLLDKEGSITDPTLWRLQKNWKRAGILFRLTSFLMWFMLLLVFVIYLFGR
jgi:hypothetical protein